MRWRGRLAVRVMSKNQGIAPDQFISIR